MQDDSVDNEWQADAQGHVAEGAGGRAGKWSARLPRIP
jgi:hypothetical protein